jgi:hypothetical protein
VRWPWPAKSNVSLPKHSVEKAYGRIMSSLVHFFCIWRFSRFPYVADFSVHGGESISRPCLHCFLSRANRSLDSLHDGVLIESFDSLIGILMCGVAPLQPLLKIWPTEWHWADLSQSSAVSSCNSHTTNRSTFIKHPIIRRYSVSILTNRLHGAGRFLRSRQLCSYSRTSRHFMEPEG